MKILVTGASGFLGSCLSAYLKNQNHEVTCLDSKNCDLTQQANIEQFNSLKYDHIYHLAAWTQAGDFCLQHPGEQWIINQKINTNILTWWQCYQPQAKMICMGTSCAYAPGVDLRECNYLTGEPIESLYTYAMTKRMLYVGLLSLHNQFNLRYLCTVPSTLYGPGYHTDGRQMHFIFDLIRKIIRGKEFNETVILWGDGYQKRELVFLNDFVKLLYRLAELKDNDIVNIGAGEEFTIRYFAETICEILDFPFEKIEYDTKRYVGAKSKCLDVQKIKDLFPRFEYTPLREGLERTIKWFYETKIYLH
ncbi:NAD-dependent epimerase/dehydratase family protein [Desulfococcaceae bacterium HSG7]|nr:NAD-dependent epimerase/dehydratase family protein [Desulfococcaceae bacterium HSG7]